jgi:hypothetical protein
VGDVSATGVVCVSLATIVFWALWAAYFNTAQFGDNVEQYNWAQSLELGYHKHPPLPSWLLSTVIRLLGPSIYWAYLLATVCLLGTAVFTWQVGRELVGERVAAASVVPWGLNMTFSQRVQLYNHNTVLVLCFSATVWLSMCASRADRNGVVEWLAAGLAAAAAILSKYQAIVPLVGLILALVWSGRLRSPVQRRGLVLAGVIMMIARAACAVGHPAQFQHFALCVGSRRRSSRPAQPDNGRAFVAGQPDTTLVARLLGHFAVPGLELVEAARDWGRCEWLGRVAALGAPSPVLPTIQKAIRPTTIGPKYVASESFMQAAPTS